MAKIMEDFEFNFDSNDQTIQESYDPSTSGFKDLFDGKFTSFQPETIISGGNNKLKSGMFDMNIEEDDDISIGYKRNEPPLEPKRPGRFF